jgi:hypothetical protein
MQCKNQYITGDPEYLKRLYDEYRNYCGRDVKMENGQLVVLALPPVKQKKKKAKEEEAPVKSDKTQASKRQRDYGARE